MKASVIISVYKNVSALELILNALAFQTEQDFEIIITEDGNSPEMAALVARFPFRNPFLHLTQADEGWRKNRALNNAVRAAKADWLIFVDGDCVPHPRFVEMHLRFSGEGRIVAGKRVKLNRQLSGKLLADISMLNRMQRALLPKLLCKQGCRYVEEGIFLSPDGWLGAVVKRRKNRHLIGSNMSLSKKSLEEINGFNEDYVLPAVGEDHDIQWRLEKLGYRMVSVKNMAVQYHLWHPENWHQQSENMELCNRLKALNQIICINGLRKEKTV